MAETPADLFDEMAARIRALKPEEFSGAILIVPPQVQGVPCEPIEVLTVEGTPNIDHFWGQTKMRVDAAVSAYAESLRRTQGFR